MAIVNTAFSKKLEKIEKKTTVNNLSEIENNILSELVPVLEKKDIALDRIADILEVYGRRLDLIELGQKNFTTLLQDRCQAPKLLQDLKAMQDAIDNKEMRQSILTSIVKKDEKGGE